MLFNWLDRNLIREERDPPHVFGNIWMVHSGAFYKVEKKLLAPSEVPVVLHWFKWQSYITWMSGFALLVVVYYSSGALLVDPAVNDISHGTAVLVGLGTLFGGFVLYDVLWRSSLAKRSAVPTVISLAGLVVVAYGLTRIFSGRAAYLHVGALLGTVMSGNVFRTIIPSQHALMASTRSGQPQDPALSLRAKERSIHNNYLTFPVLFIMLSNHFPSTFGHALNWLLLVLVMASGALVRHFMNVRYAGYRGWLTGALSAGAVGIAVVVGFLMHRAAPAGGSPPPTEVSFQAVEHVVMRRCVPCHAAAPKDPDWPSPPGGVVLERKDQIKAFAERINARVVVTRTMPLNNKTGITDDERALVGQWILQGARVD
jgi:uncharacterized membrane protein